MLTSTVQGRSKEMGITLPLFGPEVVSRYGKSQHKSTPAANVRDGQVRRWRGEDYLVCEVRGGEAAMVRLPIRRDRAVERRPADLISAESHTVFESAVDDQISVDALLDLRYLTGAQARALDHDINRHPAMQTLDRTVPERHLCLRAATPHTLDAITLDYKSVRIVAADCLMPDEMLDFLGYSARQLQLEHPDITTGIAIARGERLTLSDCECHQLWVERHWSGQVMVCPTVCESGRTVYELLGTRSSNAKGRERDWICDCDTLAEAMNTAALLRASSQGILCEMQISGRTPSEAVTPD